MAGEEPGEDEEPDGGFRLGPDVPPRVSGSTCSGQGRIAESMIYLQVHEPALTS